MAASAYVADALTLWSSHDEHLRQALLQCGLFKLDRSGQRLIARTIETDPYGSSGMTSAERFALFCQGDEYNEYPSKQTFAQELQGDAMLMQARHDRGKKHTQATWEDAVRCVRFAACYGDAHEQCPMVGVNVDNDLVQSEPAWRKRYVQSRAVYGAASEMEYDSRGATVVLPDKVTNNDKVHALVLQKDSVAMITGMVSRKTSQSIFIKILSAQNTTFRKQDLLEINRSTKRAQWTRSNGVTVQGRVLCLRAALEASTSSAAAFSAM